jgi:hypothetical protein
MTLVRLSANSEYFTSKPTSSKRLPQYFAQSRSSPGGFMVLKESSFCVNDRGFRSDSISSIAPLVWLFTEGGILYAFIRENATLPLIPSLRPGAPARTSSVSGGASGSNGALIHARRCPVPNIRNSISPRGSTRRIDQHTDLTVSPTQAKI